jgi:nitrogen fixation/metabolism regulation signal transduction histidine kinase
MQGNEAVRDAKDAFRVLLDGTTAGIEQKYQSAANASESIDGKFGLVNIVLVLAALAGVGLVATMFVVVPASIARPIEALTRAAHDMSTGNLAKSVTVGGTAEFKELGETLERMRISQQMMLDRLKTKMTPG